MAESLDIEQPDELLRYLRMTGRIGADERVATRILGGGVSNRTVWLTRETGEAWVMKQALARLRVAVEWRSDPLRIHREAAGLRWLPKLAPLDTTPVLVFEDTEHHILAMQAVAQPHDNWKELLLAGRLEADHVRQFGQWLGTVQRAAYVQRDVLRPAFDERSHFESLRLEPYYAYTAEQVPAAAAFLRELIDGSKRRRYTLTQGDYSPKNVLVRTGRLVVLDHEVIHFGDGTFDLGFSLTHFLSKAHHLPSHRDAFADAARLYWAVYCETIGDVPWAGDLEAWAVRHTVGCLLARVAGRSPLEYLVTDERRKQRDVVGRMCVDRPATMDGLIERFVNEIDE